MERDKRPHYVSLFWRLFIPNATVLGVACAVLWVEPANGRIVALVGGLAMLLAVNWLLMRRAFAPLLRLVEVMERVDPLAPGRRLDVDAPPSEVAVLADAFNDMLGRIEAERRDSARRSVAAQQQERRHISRELHDEIGQSLTAHAFHLDRLERQAPPELATEVATAHQDTLRILDDVRTLAQSLRPDVLDNIGLHSAVAAMLEHMTQRTGIDVRWEFERDLPQLDPDSELVVYRVAQEATTNAIRHAGASSVRVTLSAGDDELVLCVRDDGRGIEPDAVGGSQGGLRSMRERVLAAAGQLSIAPGPTAGTVVTLRVPAP